ncbi:MAG: hypothetical protein HY064_07870 [Bacteroidetes bacterium]|nr:hypothetical protein [Bacteroidota bacterium]
MTNTLPENINDFVECGDLLKELLPVAVKLFHGDLLSSGIETEFRENVVADIFSFRDEIKLIIHVNGGFASEKVMRLLYRVDVSQKKTERVAGNESLLAEEIVTRELQKAFTRKFYGK